MDILSQLNQEQITAVTCTEGPLLIVAGAGSGKTRVLVSRGAYFIEQGIKPNNILAITFTNKAANEMKERMLNMVGLAAEYMWVGTFHAICLKILRREYEYCCFDRNFSIYDDHDQQIVIKKCLAELELTEKAYHPRAVASEISKSKNQLITPEQYKNAAMDVWRENVGKIYKSYQHKLSQNNALDFDDIIMETVLLFQREPKRLEVYQDRFKYILVDEYQDTNHAQYKLINLLAAKWQNICVVGDPDQSIYGWRGADIGNILDFEKDYPNCQIVNLERNYRSTKNILSVANGVIENNTKRKPKKLWTEAEAGALISYRELPDERSEASYIVETIFDLRQNQKFTYRDFAILYRTNAQSRSLEDVLIKYGLPYKIFGGMRFYERKEIKDIMAYLRILVNPADNVSLGRIINFPRRGIGSTSLAKLAAIATAAQSSIYDLLADDELLLDMGGSAKRGISKFYALMESLRAMLTDSSITCIVKEVIAKTGLREALEEESGKGSVEAESRLENIDEFISVAAQFDQTAEEEAKNLTDFLAQLSLATDMDNWQEADDYISLLTLHATKGLEFPVVFITGLEEQVFPHSRAMLEERELEEERRLCYVGITRAQKHLYLTRAKSRFLKGQSQIYRESRFVKEIPEEYLDAQRISADFWHDKADFGTGYAWQKPPIKQKTSMYSSSIDSGNDGLTNTAKKQIINVGDKVQHAKFGTGMVVKTKGSADDLEISVAFPGQGIKNLMLRYAPIKKI